MKLLASIGIMIFWTSVLLGSASADNADLYSVTGVDGDDYLNVREAANAQSPIVTRIPNDGTGIRRLDGEEDQDGQIWWRIKWEGKQGWVNKRYLIAPNTADSSSGTKADDKINDSKTALHCGGNEPFWGIKITKKNLIYSPLDGDILNLPIVFNKTSENNTSIAAVYAKKSTDSVTAILKKVASCSDGMSDIDYPYSISAMINNQKFYSGCCHVK